MRQVVPLRYGVVFKKAFSRPDVFNEFAQAATGVPIHVKEVFQEYEYKQPLGNVRIKYDLFAEDVEQRAIVEIQHIKESDFWDRFLYYHIMALVEQVQGCEDYKIAKDVYTIVVLTTTPRDKKLNFSMATSEIDPIIQDADKKGERAGVYKHRIIFLNPKLVSENTPNPIQEWLKLIKDTLDSQIDEKEYTQPIFQKIIEDITKNTLTPEESARIKDDKAWEKTQADAKEEGRLEGIEQGIEQGIKQGEIKGEIKGKLEAIQSILEIKFEDQGMAWMKKIQEIQDLEKINKVLELTKKVKKIADFQKQMNQLL
jgi:predicted transposase/invertase (TIGR01784 family)